MPLNNPETILDISNNFVIIITNKYRPMELEGRTSSTISTSLAATQRRESNLNRHEFRKPRSVYTKVPFKLDFKGYQHRHKQKITIANCKLGISFLQ
ncbi:hypothetical protein Trydic_g16673 [Trypoxylus dichotomus]